MRSGEAFHGMVHRSFAPTNDVRSASGGGNTSTPANDATRKARTQAHKALDSKWDTYPKKGRRGRAYKWLAIKMMLPQEKCHIGMFDADQCQQVVELCEGTP